VTAHCFTPQHPDALYNCAVIYGETGQVEKAIFMYEMTTHVSGCRKGAAAPPLSFYHMNNRPKIPHFAVQISLH
jgi:hypothetical protein